MTDTPSRKRRERESSEDSIGNTDDLCRAVKRLHTSSSGSISLPALSPGMETFQDEASSIAARHHSGQGHIEMTRPQTRQEAPSRQSLISTAIENEQARVMIQPPEIMEGEGGRRPNLVRELPKVHVPEPVQSFESGDSVEHPSTPGKEEHTSPVQSQGYRLGTKEDYFNQGSVYDALYEEANNLLNNLHFERIQRASAN